MALPEDSSERRVMERRFGGKNIRKLVEKYEEEQANKQWLEQSTMACPSCHVHVEKSLGCNHVCLLHSLGASRVDVKLFLTDDVCKMQAAFLLPLWRQAPSEQPVHSFLDPRPPLFLEIV